MPTPLPPAPQPTPTPPAQQQSKVGGGSGGQKPHKKEQPELVSYCWYTVDEQKFPQISLPCLSRHEEGARVQYLSVRIIENTILSQFEHLNSQEIADYGNLISVSCEPAEVDLLNDINDNHVPYGARFTDKDTLVKLEEFKVRDVQ